MLRHTLSSVPGAHLRQWTLPGRTRMRRRSGLVIACRSLSTSGPAMSDAPNLTTLSREERRRLHEERQKQAHLARQEARQRHIENRVAAQNKAKERQRLHHMRLDEARQARHKADQRYRELQALSQQKSKNNLRMCAARSIPFWLNKNPVCMEQTMGALNVKLDRTEGNLNPIKSEYRQMYMDSIPSFFLKLTDSQLPTNLQTTLDSLVEAGFADLSFAKKHRDQLEKDRSEESFPSVMAEKMRTLARRREILDREREKLAELRSKQPDKRSVLEPEPESGALFDRAKSLVSNLWNASVSSADKQSRPVVEDAEKLSIDEDSVAKQLLVVERAEKATLKTEAQIEDLKQKHGSLENRLDVDDHERASKAMRQALEDTICPAFAMHIQERHSRMFDQYQTLDANTDLTKPHEWYTRARLDRRKIIFHGGPTNSGKTYMALKRLREAQKGLYLGPLRLLAAEVYETLTSQGIYTNLYTGQERREIPFATHWAATVEMASTTEDFDVVVIDEIQMIADTFRGFAWTRALLGLRCKEIHLCGGLEAESIVKKIADFCGDEFELRKYERFSALNVAKRSLASQPNLPGTYRNVQAGDCVVAFSRNDIFAIKREIEKFTKHKCCIIYGSLPPETRTKQAQLFNDPDSGYDVLVASDAIGMGLNLNIRRIIFNSMFKSNGENIVRLDHSSVKQIAGRAGRRNSPFPEGEVTCRDPDDMEHLVSCMSKDIAPIQKAGLLPTSSHVTLFYETLQKFELGKGLDELHMILAQFSEMATVKGDFFLCRQTPMRMIAKRLVDMDLPLEEKFTMCLGPVNTNCQRSLGIVKKFASKRASGNTAGLSRMLIPKRTRAFEDLSLLCSQHSELELFLWLHGRFPPGNVVEEQTAVAMKDRVIALINKALVKSEFLKLEHCYLSRDRRLRGAWKKLRKTELVDSYMEPEEVDSI